LRKGATLPNLALALPTNQLAQARMTHHFPLRVYYEDTDLAGIVYYANYLKFIERARTEWVRGLGIDQTSLKAEQGIVFAVRRLEADYLRPAKFDDELAVATTLHHATGARIVLDQVVTRQAERLFAAQVTLVCLGEDGHPARLPPALRLRLGAGMH
jgi:acyl-CoA thioester hydrolase